MYAKLLFKKKHIYIPICFIDIFSKTINIFCIINYEIK